MFYHRIYYECFSVEAPNYLSASLVKQQKDSRYYAEKKWVLLNQYQKNNSKEENHEKELIKKSLKIKLNDLSKEFIPQTFLKVMSITCGCNSKLSSH